MPGSWGHRGSGKQLGRCGTMSCSCAAVTTSFAVPYVLPCLICWWVRRPRSPPKKHPHAGHSRYPAQHSRREGPVGVRGRS